MPLQQRIARVIALFLLPAGLLCLGVPFWMFTLPGRGEIIDDSRAAFGAGTEAGKLRATYVDCVRERSGSSSSRGIGMTEYACVIDLSDAPIPAPVPIADRAGKDAANGGDSYAGLTYEEAMTKWNASIAEDTRGIVAAAEALAAHRRARGDVSNRLTRKLATNRSGALPAVRILSSPGEPRRIGLVWGFGELAWRWAQWLVISLLFLGFGGGCLLAVWVAWTRRPAGA